jgi:hypothetical protein
MDANNNIKDSINVDYETFHSSYNKNDYIHDEIQLERSLPVHESHTNYGYNIYKNDTNYVYERKYDRTRANSTATPNIGSSYMGKTDDITKKQYNLKPTINAGGFDPVPTVPMMYHENTIQEIDHQRSKLRRSIYDMQQQRNLTVGNIPYS